MCHKKSESFEKKKVRRGRVEYVFRYRFSRNFNLVFRV